MNAEAKVASAPTVKTGSSAKDDDDFGGFQSYANNDLKSTTSNNGTTGAADTKSSTQQNSSSACKQVDQVLILQIFPSVCIRSLSRKSIRKTAPCLPVFPHNSCSVIRTCLFGLYGRNSTPVSQFGNLAEMVDC
jgi:hypothetical protein